jgi:uncharacterized protein (TIGR02145 family)
LKNYKLISAVFLTSMKKLHLKNSIYLIALLLYQINYAQTATIGLQVWASKNLNVSTFQNGDSIPQAQKIEDWIAAGNNEQPAWCYYDNNPANGEKYGKLYNWYAVNDHRGLAPKGWHIPSDNEWMQLSDFLGGERKAVKKMKSISYWLNDQKGNDKSGFSALPSGFRDIDGEFLGLGEICMWWTLDENSDNHFAAWCREITIINDRIRNDAAKASGFSVRCVKD